MQVREVVDSLNLQVLAGEEFLGRETKGGYVADLLSCVMAGASADNLWITLQTHSNIIAVASLLGIAAIIVAENANVPAETLEKAKQQDVIVLASKDPIYQTIAQLVKLGL